MEHKCPCGHLGWEGGGLETQPQSTGGPGARSQGSAQSEVSE